ncbi:hypothetical protein NPIL_82601 [Nephila pilipes]|uniref:Uncharacterized protein n=1 Tax=Nephila pilipes TaxID=299642 RepID=A0A8X6PHC3_NEPPI|nr:hypothetical protein NPIL_82601 [Nephila pilipes]
MALGAVPDSFHYSLLCCRLRASKVAFVGIIVLVPLFSWSRCGSSADESTLEAAASCSNITVYRKTTPQVSLNQRLCQKKDQPRVTG